MEKWADRALRELCKGKCQVPPQEGQTPALGQARAPLGSSSAGQVQGVPGGHKWNPCFQQLSKGSKQHLGLGQAECQQQGRAGDPSLSPAQTHLLPTEAVDAPPPEMFNVRLDGALSVWSSGKCPCPRQSSWNYILKIPTSSEHSMIL